MEKKWNNVMNNIGNKNAKANGMYVPAGVPPPTKVCAICVGGG